MRRTALSIALLALLALPAQASALGFGGTNSGGDPGALQILLGKIFEKITPPGGGLLDHEPKEEEGDQCREFPLLCLLTKPGGLLDSIQVHHSDPRPSNPVPEPQSALLLGVGALVVGRRLRRRR